MVRRLQGLGTHNEHLIDVYIKHVGSILEIAVPVWHNAITQVESENIERVQKCALHIILGDNYLSYEDALNTTKLETLKCRRDQLSLKFALKAEKHSKFNNWFKPHQSKIKTRQKQDKYCHVLARTMRLMKSPISYLTTLLNNHKK